MIYTLTMNPSLDCLCAAPDFTKGSVNAVGPQALYPCGKGINVSVMLTRLGLPNTALGLCAGFTGREIARLLQEEQVSTEFVFLLQGNSRINLKLRTADAETEFNGAGPQVEENALAMLLKKLERLRRGDALVLSGSLPPGCAKDFYGTALRTIAGKGINCIVDCGDLMPLLTMEPFLVKPNHLELGAMLQMEIITPEQAARAGRMLLANGAQRVLVSMGAIGSVYVDADAALFTPAIKGRMVSPCGAGDSMVAGFLYGYPAGVREALRWGTAAGAATAFSAGVAGGGQVRACYQKCAESSVVNENSR